MRPNDFFALSPLPALPASSFSSSSPPSSSTSTGAVPAGRKTVVATSHGGRSIPNTVEGRESSWNFADRLVRLCADACGPNGFPHLELAEASGATFSAMSYAGSGSGGGNGGHQEQLSSSSSTAFAHDQHKRVLLKQYLESKLGLADEVRSRAPSSSSSSATSVATSVVTVGFRDILIKLKRFRFYSQQE
jgi:hypothetical protein